MVAKRWVKEKGGRCISVMEWSAKKSIASQFSILGDSLNLFIILAIPNK